jgi:hypothetical protein
MSEKHARMSEMTWEVQDVTNMTFARNSFEVALDKSTMDALLSDKESPWDYGDVVHQRINGYVKSVHRSLKTGGVWIIIAFE